MALGDLVRDARKQLQLSQKDFAGRLRNKDGESISPQYLNDIELNRRVPPEYLLTQLAQKLDVDEDLLRALAGQFPSSAGKRHSPEKLALALKAYRRSLEKS